MLWIILAFLGSFGWAAYWGRKQTRKCGYDCYHDHYSAGFFLAALVLGVSAVFANSYFYNAGKVYEDRSAALVNLGDGMGVQGRFFLGSGSIESNPVYMYYIDNNGQYKLHYQYSYNSYVTYTDSTPRIIWHGERSDSSFWLAIMNDWDPVSEEYIEFQVPKGSIKQNFNLDVQ